TIFIAIPSLCPPPNGPTFRGRAGDDQLSNHDDRKARPVRCNVWLSGLWFLELHDHREADEAPLLFTALGRHRTHQRALAPDTYHPPALAQQIGDFLIPECFQAADFGDLAANLDFAHGFLGRWTCGRITTSSAAGGAGEPWRL